MDNQKEIYRQKVTDILHEELDTVSTIDAIVELLTSPVHTDARVLKEQIMGLDFYGWKNKGMCENPKDIPIEDAFILREKVMNLFSSLPVQTPTDTVDQYLRDNNINPDEVAQKGRDIAAKILKEQGNKFINYAALIEDKMYPVLYTILQSGEKVFEPKWINGKDLTEPQIKYLYELGYFSNPQPPTDTGCLYSLDFLKEMSATMLESYGELIRTLSRLSNNWPHAFIEEDFKRLERAKKIFGDLNKGNNHPKIVQSEYSQSMQTEIRCNGCGCNKYRSELNSKQQEVKQCINCHQWFMLEDGEVFDIESPEKTEI